MENDPPVRAVVAYREVPNIYDSAFIAVEFTLDCGHTCVLTGSRIYKFTSVACQECADVQPTATDVVLAPDPED